jgi:hypothetical protein
LGLEERLLSACSPSWTVAELAEDSGVLERGLDEDGDDGGEEGLEAQSSMVMWEDMVTSQRC